MITKILWIFVGSWLLSLLATPVVRLLAHRVGLVDLPDGTRKLHDKGIPLGGGVAVFFATCATMMAAWQFFPPLSLSKPIIPAAVIHPMLSFLLSASVVVLVGLVDDRFRLRGRQKLAGQILAAMILIGFGGLSVSQITFWNTSIALGIAAVPFTLIWLVGAINAINLIDGADGMACTVGIILSVALGIMAMLTNHMVDAAIAFAMAGALLGFFCFNSPPASIFLGDAGSMLIGLTLGTLAIRCSLKGPTTVALIAPAAIMSIPFFDSIAAIVRRILTGRSIYSTDRGHLHHCLLRTGMRHRTMLLLVALLCLVTSAGAVASVYVRNELVALLTVFAVVVILITSRVFGHAESKLVMGWLVSLAESIIPLNKTPKRPSQLTVRLQGSGDWDRIWEILMDFALRHELYYLKLDVNAAWIHEGYHGLWRARELPDENEAWSTRLPLVSQSRIIGHLEVGGPCTAAESYSILSVLAELLDSLDDYFRDGSLVPEPKLTALPAKAASVKAAAVPTHASVGSL